MNIKDFIRQTVIFTKMDKSGIPGEGIGVKADPVIFILPLSAVKKHGNGILGLVGRRLKNVAFRNNTAEKSVEKEMRLENLFDKVMDPQPELKG
jgi:hypothetical protein